MGIPTITNKSDRGVYYVSHYCVSWSYVLGSVSLAGVRVASVVHKKREYTRTQMPFCAGSPVVEIGRTRGRWRAALSLYRNETFHSQNLLGLVSKEF